MSTIGVPHLVKILTHLIKGKWKPYWFTAKFPRVLAHAFEIQLINKIASRTLMIPLNEKNCLIMCCHLKELKAYSHLLPCPVKLYYCFPNGISTLWFPSLISLSSLSSECKRSQMVNNRKTI